jgi:hypothetical protein
MMHAVISEVKDRFVPVFISAVYGFADAHLTLLGAEPKAGAI